MKYFSFLLSEGISALPGAYYFQNAETVTSPDDSPDVEDAFSPIVSQSTEEVSTPENVNKMLPIMGVSAQKIWKALKGNEFLKSRFDLSDGWIRTNSGSYGQTFSKGEKLAKIVILKSPAEMRSFEQEASNSEYMSQRGVGPEFYFSDTVNLSENPFISAGIVMMERYDSDLLPRNMSKQALSRTAEINEQVCSRLIGLGDAGFFCTDLKPENIVIKIRANVMKVRLIDFGGDFCTSYNNKNISGILRSLDLSTRNEFYDVLKIVMMIVYYSNIVSRFLNAHVAVGKCIARVFYYKSNPIKIYRASKKWIRYLWYKDPTFQKIVKHYNQRLRSYSNDEGLLQIVQIFKPIQNFIF